MPVQKYALEVGGPKRLEVTWKGFLNGLVLTVDGKKIGSFENRKALKKGAEFRLADGSSLKVQWARNGLFPELHLERNGESIPGSPSDPLQKLGLACGIIFFIAGLNLILGLAAEFYRIPLLLKLGIGTGSCIVGVIFFVLGYFIKKGSSTALSAAVAIFVVDGLLTAMRITGKTGVPPTGAIVVRIILLIPLIRGFSAIRDLEKRRKRRELTV